MCRAQSGDRGSKLPLVSLFSRSRSTIRTLLHGKINPKDWQVLSLGDVGFLQFFGVVSGDYGKPCRWWYLDGSLFVVIPGTNVMNPSELIESSPKKLLQFFGDKLINSRACVPNIRIPVIEFGMTITQKGDKCALAHLPASFSLGKWRGRNERTRTSISTVGKILYIMTIWIFIEGPKD